MAIVPDPVILAEALRAAGLPHELSFHPTSPSTQGVARQLVATHGPHHWAVVAVEQTAGRGRLDRLWLSRKGDLTCSLVWPVDLPPERWGKLGILAGLATTEAIRQIAGVDARVKWPNDVFLRAGKVAGCLGEIVETPRGSAAVIGIGVNLVTQTLDGLPTPALYPITTLAHRQPPVRPEDLLVAIAELLQARLDWIRPSHDAEFHAWWEALSLTLGRQVELLMPEGRVITATVMGLEPNGALRVEDLEGVEHRILAGDVRLAVPNLEAAR